jgi:hypothetical protein
MQGEVNKSSSRATTEETNLKDFVSLLLSSSNDKQKITSSTWLLKGSDYELWEGEFAVQRNIIQNSTPSTSNSLSSTPSIPNPSSSTPSLSNSSSPIPLDPLQAQLTGIQTNAPPPITSNSDLISEIPTTQEIAMPPTILPSQTHTTIIIMTESFFDWTTLDLSNFKFWGCKIPPYIARIMKAQGAEIIETPPDYPFFAFRNSMYSQPELAQVDSNIFSYSFEY